MHKREKEARIALNGVKGVTSIKFQQIINHYGSAQKFLQERQLSLDLPSAIKLNCENCWVWGEENYPKLLAQIPDAPPVLYYRGKVDALSGRNLVAIVGTRNVTEYGRRAAVQIAESVIAAGNIIVSGMAFGIDRIVHEVALANKAPTIAVLGTDVNTPYPTQHRDLWQKIQNTGLVISENAKTVGYNKWVFPRRNRIIAGLSFRTYVVEAAVKSGALLTANYAFDYNRELIAVPGSIYSDTSAGCNLLIAKNKAEIYIPNALINISKPKFIIENAPNQSKEYSLLTELVNLINQGYDTIDDLAAKILLSRDQVEYGIAQLEIQKIIAKDFFGRYSVLS